MAVDCKVDSVDIAIDGAFDGRHHHGFHDTANTHVPQLMDHLTSPQHYHQLNLDASAACSEAHTPLLPNNILPQKQQLKQDLDVKGHFGNSAIHHNTDMNSHSNRHLPSTPISIPRPAVSESLQKLQSLLTASVANRIRCVSSAILSFHSRPQNLPVGTIFRVSLTAFDGVSFACE
jgi:hypothetical protein